MTRPLEQSLAVGLAYRLGRLAVVLLLVAAVAFSLAKISPIDPVNAYLGDDIARVGPEQKALIAERWGLNEAPLTQFVRWAQNILQGDLGHSMIYNAPVSEVIASRFWTSLPLVGLAWLLSGILGFALGVVAGANSGSWIDRVIRVYAYVLSCAPTFWIAILLLLAFAVFLGWAPVCCAGPIGVVPEDVTFSDRLRHLALPLAALTVFGVSQVALHTRAKMIEILNLDAALYARAQGATKLDIVLRHGLRNAALPAVTILFASLGELFGGSILAEQVFSYPGLGQATVAAGIKGDVPLLLAITLCLTLFVSVGNMIADMLYRLVDPRIRDGDLLTGGDHG